MLMKKQHTGNGRLNITAAVFLNIFFFTETEKAEVSVRSRTTFEYRKAELPCLQAWDSTNSACVGASLSKVCAALFSPTMQLLSGTC